MNEENLNNTDQNMNQVPEMPAQEVPVVPEAPIAPEMPATPEMPAAPEMTAPEAAPMTQEPTPAEQPAAPVQEKGSFGWAVLGFFIPLIGIILFFVWKKDRHGDAKMAGVGALVSIIISVVFGALAFVLAFKAVGDVMDQAQENLNNIEQQQNVLDWDYTTVDDNTEPTDVTYDETESTEDAGVADDDYVEEDYTDVEIFD